MERKIKEARSAFERCCSQLTRLGALLGELEITAGSTVDPNRGFAGMDPDRLREVSSKGGQAMPDEKRSFSQNRYLAAYAGHKGGKNVPDEKRSFSQNRELAAEAGRKGRQAQLETN